MNSKALDSNLATFIFTHPIFTPIHYRLIIPHKIKINLLNESQKHVLRGQDNTIWGLEIVCESDCNSSFFVKKSTENKSAYCFGI